MASHVVLVLICAAASVCCAASPDLNTIFTDFMEARVNLSPNDATALGRYSVNDQLTDYTAEQFNNENNLARDFLARIEQVDRTTLSGSDLNNYDVLKFMLEYRINGFNWFDYVFGNPVTFLEGVTTNAFRQLLKGNTSEDYQLLLGRLRKYSTLLTQQKTAMMGAVSRGLTNHNVTMVRAVENINKILNVSTPNETDFYKAMEKSPLEPGEQRDAYLTEVADIITAVVLPSLRDLLQYVEQEYMPHTREKVGVNSFPRGLEFYQACADFHTSTGQPWEEIHELGLQEVERIRGEIQKLLDRENFSGTIKQYIDKIRADPNSYLNTSEEILAYYNDTMDLINSKLSTIFHESDFPKAPVLVKASLYDGPLASYSPPSPGSDEPGIFYANVLRPKKHALFLSRALTAHEANPGHHFQLALQIEDPNLPLFRRFISSEYFLTPNQYPYFTAFPEGWGLYSEYLGEEMGIYDNDFHLFGRYTLEIWRAVRLVVDTGLHAKNWTRTQAIDYLTLYLADSDEGIAAEVDRYITIPGQALAYKIGELKIKELRQRAAEALGSKFDVKDFHHQVLRLGNAPLSVLERVIDNWIAESKQAISSAGLVSPGVLLVLTAVLCNLRGLQVAP